MNCLRAFAWASTPPSKGAHRASGATAPSAQRFRTSAALRLWHARHNVHRENIHGVWGCATSDQRFHNSDQRCTHVRATDF